MTNDDLEKIIDEFDDREYARITRRDKLRETRMVVDGEALRDMPRIKRKGKVKREHKRER